MKTLSTLFFVLYCTIIQAQCIVNTPYLEGFEIGVFSSCLTQDSSLIALNWYVATGPTPTIGTGPSAANTGNYYTYIETSTPTAPNDSAILYTPHINTANLNVPALYFHYHQYGNDYMQLRVQYKIVGSNNWQTVFHQVGSVQQSTTDAYEQVYVPLLDAIDTLIQVRFIGIAGANDGVSTDPGLAFHSDIALDDIRIDEVIEGELALTNLSIPVNSCDLGMETVAVEITNIGYSPKDSITITLEWNGTNSANYFIQNPISGNGGKDTVFFNIDFSNIQQYDFIAYIVNNNDFFSSNDTLYDATYKHSIVSTVPHFNNFENGSIGWYGTGDWEYGQPNGNVITSAASGQNAFVTNLVSNYQADLISYLYSPCFSFSSSINPVLKFSAFWDIETNWDGAWLESSIDNGVSWQKMEDINGTGQNWYSDSLTNIPLGWVWNGWNGDGSGGWVNTVFNLYPFRFDTVPHVNFRFVLYSDPSSVAEGMAIDNFSIIDSCYTLTLQPEIQNPTFDILNNGTVTLQTIGGGGDYTYSWSHGVQGDYLDDLVEGSYTVTITDFNGCTSIDSLELVNVCSDSMSITFIIDNVSISSNLQDTTLGSIQAIINHAVPPYTYNWNIGNTTNTISNLSAGLYIVNVIDVNNCMVNDYVLLENIILKTNKIETLKTFQFFPNPTQDRLNINLEFSKSVDLSVKIIDINGRELISLDAQNQAFFNTFIDCTSYPNSMYFLQITVDGQKTTKPFLIVK